MKTVSKLLSSLCFILISSNALFAETIQTTDILGEEKDTNTETVVENGEDKREADFLNQLLLDIPVLTDNPSHIITFVDPSENKSGVSIEIDGKSFQEIKSPYSLPALSIGNHELRFKFVDKYGSTQIIEKEIIIIPRPPIISSPNFTDDSLLQISGTGLSNSEIVLIISSRKNIVIKEATIDGEGKWSISISKEDLDESVYTFTAYTRRYGYASNLAEPITFKIGDSDSISLDNINGDSIHFAFKDIPFDNVSKFISENVDLMILIVSTFTIGFLLSFFLFNISKDKSYEKSIKTLENKISKKPEKELTLKEKLTKTEEKPLEKKKEEKVKKEDRVVTKIDFLKDFKMFDPDDEKGKEKDNIKVTVTSKD